LRNTHWTTAAFLCRVRDTREFDNTEQEAEVNFADPDAALTDALDDMPLSDAALEITDIVRDDSTIPRFPAEIAFTRPSL
jgi:hypothetical protein